jgi:hypothetical protein
MPGPPRRTLDGERPPPSVEQRPRRQRRRPRLRRRRPAGAVRLRRARRARHRGGRPPTGGAARQGDLPAGPRRPAGADLRPLQGAGAAAPDRPARAGPPAARVGVRARRARPGRRPRRDRAAAPRRPAPGRPAAAGQGVQCLPAGRRALGGDRPHAAVSGLAGDRPGPAAAEGGRQRRRVPLHPGVPRRPLDAVALHWSSPGQSRYRRVALVARMRLAAAPAAGSSSPPASTSSRSTLASARRHTVAPHQCISG